MPVFVGTRRAIANFEVGVADVGTPWTPAEVPLHVWWDAQNTASLTIDTGTVSAISDLSGNTRTAVQATSGKRPLYVASSNISGLPAFRSSSSGDTAMTFSHWPTGLFGMWLQTSVLTGLNANFIGTTGSTRASNTAYDLSAATIVAIISDGANWTYYEDGVAAGTGAASIPACSFFAVVQAATTGGGGAARLLESGVLFNRSTATGRAWDGDIGEIVCGSDGALASLDKRQKMEGYLAHHWSLTSNLAFDHPYKISPPTVDALPSGFAFVMDGDDFVYDGAERVIAMAA